MAVLISWLCFASGAYHFTQAAAISGSPWLMDFGFSGLGNNHHPSFWNALSEGSFLTFYNGEYHFDSSLWTMRPEIIGSVICLGVAPALRWTQGIIVPFCLIAIISTMLIGAEQHIPQFLAGTLLSRVLHERTYRLSSAIAIPLIAVAFILFSYDGPVGSFAWMRASGLTDWRTFPILWTPAAVILIYVTMGTPWIGRWLSGRIARLLGRLSFPIYLIHLPVLCSMGAWTYSELSPMLRWQIAVALTWIVTFLGTFLCALPLSLFDRWWVGRVNIFTRAFAPERSSGGSAGNRNNETSA